MINNKYNVPNILKILWILITKLNMRYVLKKLNFNDFIS